jgi:hypothetical protein
MLLYQAIEQASTWLDRSELPEVDPTSLLSDAHLNRQTTRWQDSQTRSKHGPLLQTYGRPKTTVLPERYKKSTDKSSWTKALARLSYGRDNFPRSSPMVEKTSL